MHVDNIVTRLIISGKFSVFMYYSRLLAKTAMSEIFSFCYLLNMYFKLLHEYKKTQWWAIAALGGH